MGRTTQQNPQQEQRPPTLAWMPGQSFGYIEYFIFRAPSFALSLPRFAASACLLPGLLISFDMPATRVHGRLQ
jgi:hypothetical protein